MVEALEIQDKHDYILATFSGDFSVDSSRQTIDEILQACLTYARSAVVLDCRTMTGSLPVFGRYQVAVYGEKTIGMISKFALVRKQEKGPVDRFTETVARNRGINLRLFTDIDQAIDWLKT